MAQPTQPGSAQEKERNWMEVWPETEESFSLYTFTDTSDKDVSSEAQLSW